MGAGFRLCYLVSGLWSLVTGLRLLSHINLLHIILRLQMQGGVLRHDHHDQPNADHEFADLDAEGLKVAEVDKAAHRVRTDAEDVRHTGEDGDQPAGRDETGAEVRGDGGVAVRPEAQQGEISAEADDAEADEDE